ncbi:MAG: thymidylate synthase [Balneolaceae bacterium]|nr:thymidylate synthase [Balneolaceae bacterium]
MQVYHDLVQRVLDNGVLKENRTGTDTISNFAEFYRVDLSEGFPLLTTKKVFFRSVIYELLWYLRGDDHVKWLRDDQNVHIWDAWAREDGYVGPIYPVLWRRYPSLKVGDSDQAYIPQGESRTDVTWRYDEVDQVSRVIEMIKANPNSRRMVVNTWHPGLLDEMALPPCHIMYIFNVSGGKLHCHLTQRSGDIALGIPFNLACYAALTMAIAQETGLEPGTFAHTIVDAHIYVNHIEGLKEQLTRTPKPLPTLTIAKKPLDQLSYDDFTLDGYDPDPGIRFEVAV